MSDITRAEAIEILSDKVKPCLKNTEWGKALDFAIDSLKVDEAYNLMYEGVDFVEIPKGATNGDVIKAIFLNEVGYGEGATCIYYRKMCFDLDWWNSPYRKE